MTDVCLASSTMANPGGEEVGIFEGYASWLFNQASHFSCVAVGQTKGAQTTVRLKVAEGDPTSCLNRHED